MRNDARKASLEELLLDALGESANTLIIGKDSDGLCFVADTKALGIIGQGEGFRDAMLAWLVAWMQYSEIPPPYGLFTKMDYGSAILAQLNEEYKNEK